MTPDPAVEAELGRLNDLPLASLKALWKERFGTASKHQSADLLRRCLAYELQVRAYGGLSADIRRRLGILHRAFSQDSSFAPQAGRNLKIGTVLTREWKGTVHQVRILDDGFEYLAERYGSLTEISKRITGSKWSGPAFFGLRKSGQK